MKIQQSILTVTVAAALIAVVPGISASTRNPDVPTQMVITVLPTHGGAPPEPVAPADITIVEGKTPATVVGLQRFTGDFAAMQLFILLDDSSQSASLSIHFPELRTFIESLPASTQVAVGYMRNGAFPLTQSFTSDHRKAADALRLPLASPGLNGSPYFTLSDLVGHWPSKEASPRGAVLMLTDGVDPYYDTSIVNDPYVDTAIRDAAKEGVAVYSIYLRGAGTRNAWVTNVAQSRLDQAAQETGGNAYFQDFSDPVTIAPFLKDLQDRFANQYQITFAAFNARGLQSVKLRTALPGLKITAPTRVWAP